MRMTTTLDVDLVAVENDHEVMLLLEITAPTPPVSNPRAPATLQIVLDRSGSMAGDRLDGAKTALLTLIDRLDPTDNLGVIAFDNTVEIVVPTGPLSNKHAVKAAIAAVEAGGSTDLSGGYLRGLQEARRVAGPAGATLLLISDGHANAGVTDPERLGPVAADAHTHGVTTSTLGFGLGYDEVLLAALACGGSGNELFAPDADTAGALIAGEIDGLLDQVAQAVSLQIHLTPHVKTLTLFNDLPRVTLPHGVGVELGTFYTGETRRLMLSFEVPSVAALGLLDVASLELVYVSLSDLVQHTHTLPVVVNVVPGDETRGLVPNPVVRSEALFQSAQQAKQRAGRLLSEGLVAGALQAFTDAQTILADALVSDAFTGAPPEVLAGLDEELSVLRALAHDATIDRARAAKTTSADYSRKSRTRGRQSRTPLTDTHETPTA